MNQTCGPVPNSVYSLETSEVTAQYIHQPQQGTSLHCVLPNDIEIQNSLNMLEPTFHRSARQPFISGFDTTSSQVNINAPLVTRYLILQTSLALLT